MSESMLGNGQSPRRQPVNERARCQQIERDGVAVENHPQAPFSLKIAPDVGAKASAPLSP